MLNTVSQKLRKKPQQKKLQQKNLKKSLQMMKKNSSIDKSLFVLIAKIGKTRGLKGEFFLRSFAEKLETLTSFKKFFSLQSCIMEEVFFEYIKKSNNNFSIKKCLINNEILFNVLLMKIIYQINMMYP